MAGSKSAKAFGGEKPSTGSKTRKSGSKTRT